MTDDSMDRDDLKERVLALLGYSEEVWGVDRESVEEVAFMEQGWVDSIQIVGVLIDIEDQLGVVLTTEDTERDEIRTVGGLLGIIEARAADNEARPN